MTLTAPSHLRGPMTFGGPMIEERRQWIEAAVLAGRTVPQISEALGVTTGSVRSTMTGMAVAAGAKSGAVMSRAERLDTIVAYVADHPDCRAGAIMIALGLSDNMVSDAFQSLKAAKRIHATTRYTYRVGPAPDPKPKQRAAPTRDVRQAIVMTGETCTLHTGKPVAISLPREPWSDGSAVEVGRHDVRYLPTIRSNADWRKDDPLLRGIDKGATPRRNAIGGAEA